MPETISGLVFVKAGGSFITFKDKPFSINYRALLNLSSIIRRGLQGNVRILLGNGGGSFAHPVVDTFSGGDPVRLLVHCQRATRLLNRLVVDHLVENDIPATSMQTSAFIFEEHGVFRVFIEPLRNLVINHVIPVVYGECISSADNVYRVLSTEDVFSLISTYLKPERIILLTDVDGVYTCDPRRCRDAELITRIDRTNYHDVLKSISGSGGIDVTGGIRGKIEKMMKLSGRIRVPIIIVSGFNIEESVKAIVRGRIDRGTYIIGY